MFLRHNNNNNNNNNDNVWLKRVLICMHACMQCIVGFANKRQWT